MLGVGKNIKIILSVGHLNRQKDRLTLVQAIHFLKLNGQFKNTLCLIVGEGTEYSHVRTMIQTFQLESSIRLLPAASDVEALYNIAEFCVVSSLYEAGPYVILEAASLSKPSVGTSVGFIPSFIGSNEAGICVAPSNPQLLADAIFSLLSNPKKTAELGEKAYERFSQDYTYNRLIENTISVYQDTLLQ